MIALKVILESLSALGMKNHTAPYLLPSCIIIIIIIIIIVQKVDKALGL